MYAVYLHKNPLRILYTVKKKNETGSSMLTDVVGDACPTLISPSYFYINM